MTRKTEFFLTRFDSVKRHLRNSIRHVTIKKLVNMIRNEIEFRCKNTNLSSVPYFIKVEPTSNCHLRCPQCEHGKEKPKNKENIKMIMSLNNFEKIIEPFADKLFGVCLSHRGEPLLNPYLFQIIAYCHERNIGTEFPTSFSLKLSQEQIKQMVISGLDHLIVSIDGVTQDVYEKYRIGGNLNLVIRNASTLIREKKRLNSKTPFIEFKFILFEHNRHQLAAAEELAKNMGFDKFSVVSDDSFPPLNEIRNQVKSKKLAKKKACFWPWSSMVIYCDGTVSPCCTRHFMMGNALENPINLIWNNDKYKKLRLCFTEQNLNECEHCLKNCWPR